jgi:acid phosphatase family membrane protein YuiD
VEGFSELLSNKVLISAVLAWFSAQVTKMIRDAVNGKFRWDRLTGAGGMPSAHTSLVVSSAMACGLTTGFGSPLFGIAFVVAGIVMYDAAGVRHHAGRQARIINRIIQDMKAEHPLRKIRLKELIGHTPIEVLVGALQGIAVAWLVCRVLYV